jgi:hypothetical protein
MPVSYKVAKQWARTNQVIQDSVVAHWRKYFDKVVSALDMMVNMSDDEWLGDDPRGHAKHIKAEKLLKRVQRVGLVYDE